VGVDPELVFEFDPLLFEEETPGGGEVVMIGIDVGQGSARGNRPREVLKIFPLEPTSCNPTFGADDKDVRPVTLFSRGEDLGDDPRDEEGEEEGDT